MSWFSRAFSMAEEDEDEDERRRKGEENEDEEEEDEEDEENDSLNLAEIASATGASIKEDFSNLRKTFTRQLWGVASFIAPPPPSEKSSMEEGGTSQEEELVAFPQQHGNDEEGRGLSVAAASDIESRTGRVGELGLGQSNATTSRGTTSGGAFLDREESDPKLVASPRENNNDVADNVVSSGENQGFERPKLTGLRSDFAELRGTVATGISRITSVLREVTGDDESGEDDEGLEQEHLPLVSSRESPHHPLSSPVGGERQGVNSPRPSFDTFFKPLFGNMLMREKSSSIEGDSDPAEDEGAEGGSYYSRESPKGKGAPTYGELESLPSAIASGIGGISKFASSLLQIVTDELDGDLEDGEEGEDLAVGLTEPVVTFARNIAVHPETWLDFPLPDDDDDDEFELTDAQQKHIRALEQAAPGLQALKIELCPSYMTEGHFWKIYFVLMHSRLSSNDALMLSNQQVVRARASMQQEMQKRELQIDEFEPRHERMESDSVDASLQDIEQAENEFGRRLSTPPTNNSAISNPPVSSSIEDTSQAGKISKLHPSMGGSKDAAGLIHSKPDKGRFSMLRLEDETEVDEWPDEEPSSKQHETGDPDSRLDTSTLGDEDVSFSDLEEDDSSDKATFINEGTSLSSPKSPASVVPDSPSAIPLVPRETSSPMTQGDGTPRKSSERGEFNDWFKVDQDDVASSGSSSP